jgi:amino acid permease
VILISPSLFHREVRMQAERIMGFVMAAILIVVVILGIHYWH